MITRSIDRPFQLTDWTEEMSVIPNQWGLLESLDLFSTESVAQHSVTFEEIVEDDVIIVDRIRGDRQNVGKDFNRKIHSFVVPHFNYNDYISPQDLQAQRAYGGQEADPMDAARARKMKRIKRAWSRTLETARFQLITAGTVYAPGGTIGTQDWNSEFGVTRVSVDFVFGTSTTEVLDKIEQGIAQVQDNTGGEDMTGVMVLASPTFFRKLITHPSTKVAYQYYSSTEEPLRRRLAKSNGVRDTLSERRTFDHGGVLFVECRDRKPDGSLQIPDGDAYMIPLGTENVFKTYYSPAHKFDLVNTLGEPLYMFEYNDGRGEQVTLESESNFVNALMRPAMIVRLFSST